MRTRQCRKLRDAVCHDACGILLYADRILTFKPQELHTDLNYFARLDGFIDWQEMREWFIEAHGLPFQGFLIRWLVPPATLVQ